MTAALDARPDQFHVAFVLKQQKAVLVRFKKADNF